MDSSSVESWISYFNFTGSFDFKVVKCSDSANISLRAAFFFFCYESRTFCWKFMSKVAFDVRSGDFYQFCECMLWKFLFDLEPLFVILSLILADLSFIGALTYYQNSKFCWKYLSKFTRRIESFDWSQITPSLLCSCGELKVCTSWCWIWGFSVWFRVRASWSLLISVLWDLSFR